MKPRVKITDAKFSYSPACDTDVRRLFKRVRKAQAEQKRREREQQSADSAVIQANFAARRDKERA